MLIAFGSMSKTYDNLRYPCIRSERHLKQIRAGTGWSGERELLARCRHLDRVTLKKYFVKPMVITFLRVQKYMYEQFDIVHLNNWVENQNKYRRKRKVGETQQSKQKKLQKWYAAEFLLLELQPRQMMWEKTRSVASNAASIRITALSKRVQLAQLVHWWAR